METFCPDKPIQCQRIETRTLPVHEAQSHACLMKPVACFSEYETVVGSLHLLLREFCDPRPSSQFRNWRRELTWSTGYETHDRIGVKSAQELPRCRHSCT